MTTGVALTVIVVGTMLRQRRTPSATIAWLLGIVLIPPIGIPLYLLLGGRRQQRISTSKPHLKLMPPKEEELNEREAIGDRLLVSYGIPHATDGHTFSLCQNGEEVYARLVEMIESARESIHIATYTFSLDATGRTLLRLLEKRAKDGIDVRLLLDGVGSFRTSRWGLRGLSKAGGQLAYFLPVWRPRFLSLGNLRNHRKIVIVDGKCVLAGGTNIADEYIGPHPKTGRWKDLSFVIEGPAVANYANIFRNDWNFSSRHRLEPDGSKELLRASRAAGEAVIQVLPSGPDVPGAPLYAALVSAIYEADQRLWIVTPYFLPDDALTDALCIAARRGVDVRVFVPKDSTSRLTDLARSSFLRELEAAGCRVLLYSAGMLHAKVILIDDNMALVGSANVDIRSMFLNYEVMSIVYSPAEVSATAAWIETLMPHVNSGIDRAGPLRGAIEGVARTLAPLL